jgi:hypothetical protein
VRFGSLWALRLGTADNGVGLPLARNDKTAQVWWTSSQWFWALAAGAGRLAKLKDHAHYCALT